MTTTLIREWFETTISVAIFMIAIPLAFVHFVDANLELNMSWWMTGACIIACDVLFLLIVFWLLGAFVHVMALYFGSPYTHEQRASRKRRGKRDR